MQSLKDVKLFPLSKLSVLGFKNTSDGTGSPSKRSSILSIDNGLKNIAAFETKSCAS